MGEFMFLVDCGNEYGVGVVPLGTGLILIGGGGVENMDGSHRSFTSQVQETFFMSEDPFK